MDNNINQNPQALNDSSDDSNSVQEKQDTDKDILTLLGLDTLDEEEKTAVYSKMLDTIHNRAMVTVYDKLGSDDGEHWKELLEQGRSNEAGKFLLDRKIDLRAVMFQEAMLYKVEVKHLAENFKQAVSSNE